MGELCVCSISLFGIHTLERFLLSSQSCLGVKGREKQTIGEVYELFESVSDIFRISPFKLITHMKTSDSV